MVQGVDVNYDVKVLYRENIWNASYNGKFAL